jgi:potassium efflux system protein
MAALLYYFCKNNIHQKTSNALFMKKYVLLLLLLIPTFSSHAVLREENLDKTIIMLYTDLQSVSKNMNNYMSRYDNKRKEFWAELNATTKDCQESALVLYSQEDYYLFGMSQACQRITNTYNRFKSQEYPFTMWKDSFQAEIIRYSRLMRLLSHISDASLSPTGRADRRRCIGICNGIENQLRQYHSRLDTDSRQYQIVNMRMEDIEKYNITRFNQIRDKVFLTGSESYFTTLAHFGERWHEFIHSVHYDFFEGQNASPDWVARRWQLLGSGLGLFLLSLFISFSFMKWFCPKKWRKPSIMAKKNYIIATMTAFLFSFLMIFTISFLLQRYYFIVATSIFIEFTLLVGIILLSLSLRLDAEHIGQGLKFYLQAISIAAILIWYRIALVSNIIVSFTLPILFIAFLAWHLYVLIHDGRGATRADTFFSWFTFVLALGCTILCWSGYRFLSLQLIILWLILLTSIQLIICLRHLLGLTAVHNDKETLTVKEIWFDSLMDKLILPLISIMLFVGSIIWASHIFSMSTWVIELFKAYFINMPTVAIVSVENILWLFAIAIIFNYAIFIVKEILHSIYEDNYDSGIIPVCVTIGTILLWGIYIIIVVILLHINNQGIVAAVGGISMGVGFALKDTINNLFCGLSLMTGRVRVGDIIECDGIRGKIINVGIRSTIVETIDGYIIAFLNNQLFTKNFKNLTKNHGYELDNISVDVPYNINIEDARKAIVDSLSHTDFLAPSHAPEVIINNFGDNGVSLGIIVWTPVASRVFAISKVREIIYMALQKAGIEIPGPQRDIHIKDMPVAPK